MTSFQTLSHLIRAIFIPLELISRPIPQVFSVSLVWHLSDGSHHVSVETQHFLPLYKLEIDQRKQNNQASQLASYLANLSTIILAEQFAKGENVNKKKKKAQYQLLSEDITLKTKLSDELTRAAAEMLTLASSSCCHGYFSSVNEREHYLVGSGTRTAWFTGHDTDKYVFITCFNVSADAGNLELAMM